MLDAIIDDIVEKYGECIIDGTIFESFYGFDQCAISNNGNELVTGRNHWTKNDDFYMFNGYPLYHIPTGTIRRQISNNLYLKDGTELKYGIEVYWVIMSGVNMLVSAILTTTYNIDVYNFIHTNGSEFITPSFGSKESLYKYCKEKDIYCEELYDEFNK